MPVPRRRTWVLALLLMAASAPLFSDIRQSVLDLLTHLSRDYLEFEKEVFFRSPLAVVPFLNQSPLAREHEVAAVVDELIRAEIVNSTYFILTERENLPAILEEIELALSDLADTSQAVRVGELTSAQFLLAGSVTEAGGDFLLNGRLIDVETGRVIGAASVAVAKDELIEEAQAARFEYVTRYGLGIHALGGGDFLLAGIPRTEALDGAPQMARASAGVSYRPRHFLQITSSINVAWGELQYGEFDPGAAEYDNTDWLALYYGIPPSVSTLPSYAVEYSQTYLDAQVFLVWQPWKRLALSVGGGGLLGAGATYAKLSNYPVYIGPVDPATDLPVTSPINFAEDERYWFTKNVVIDGGSTLLYGALAAAKVEYFLSPRLVLSLTVQYRWVLSGQTIRYTLGGVAADEGDRFYELSGWYPDRSPYGDDLNFDSHSLGIFLGISGSF